MDQTVETPLPPCRIRIIDWEKHPVPPVAGPLALPEAPKGLALVSVEMFDGTKCFKCVRVGHFQSKCDFKPFCTICREEGHASAYLPSQGKQLVLQTMGDAIHGEGFLCLPFDEQEDQLEE
ncbi:Heat stress transcription factor C-1b [Hordeum vulgare]|nr:Heat stress transcription factor C-1b [Hordeum vulgare]